MTGPIAITWFLLVIVAKASGASDVLNYENRVFRAGEQVERIKTDKEYSVEGIDTIKHLLPRSEDIRMNDQVVEVNNTWLYVMLDSYTAESDPQQKKAKLDEVAERLEALDEHLRAVVSEVSGNKAASKSHEQIERILARREYKQKSESAIAAFIRRVRESVFEFLRDMYIRLAEALFGEGTRANWFFRGLIIAGLVVLLGVAVRMVMGIKRGERRKKKRTVLGEELDSDLTAADLANAATAAARAGDFRTAMRKLYISLLYDLAERNLIELEPNATNREYLARVSRYPVLVKPMLYMTDRFDYFWYGMFPSSEQDFSSYLESYKEAMARARNLGEQAVATA